MKVAASVCGGTDYWHSWRATGNALEELPVATMMPCCRSMNCAKWIRVKPG